MVRDVRRASLMLEAVSARDAMASSRRIEALRARGPA